MQSELKEGSEEDLGLKKLGEFVGVVLALTDLATRDVWTTPPTTTTIMSATRVISATTILSITIIISRMPTAVTRRTTIGGATTCIRRDKGSMSGYRPFDNLNKEIVLSGLVQQVLK